jgi:mannitol/fructose-specific phosphotransferase system IIA component (Ntr-type)
MDENTSRSLKRKSINTYIDTERVNKGEEFCEIIERCANDKDFFAIIKRCADDKDFFAIIERCANDKEFFEIIEHCIEDQKPFENMACNAEDKNFSEIIERCADDKVFFAIIERCANDKEFLETVKYRTNDKKLLQLKTIEPPQPFAEAKKFYEENLKFLQPGEQIEEKEYKKLLERLKLFKNQTTGLSLASQASRVINMVTPANFFDAAHSGDDKLPAAFKTASEKESKQVGFSSSRTLRP